MGIVVPLECLSGDVEGAAKAQPPYPSSQSKLVHLKPFTDLLVRSWALALAQASSRPSPQYLAVAVLALAAYGAVIPVSAQIVAGDVGRADLVRQSERGMLATAPRLAVGLAGLPAFRGVNAVQADALATDLDGVGIDDAGAAGDVRRGRAETDPAQGRRDRGAHHHCRLPLHHRGVCPTRPRTPTARGADLLGWRIGQRHGAEFAPYGRGRGPAERPSCRPVLRCGKSW